MNLSPLSWSRQDDRFFVSFGHEFGINPENAYFRIFGMGFVKNTTRRIQHLQYFNKRRHFKYILFLFLKNINLQITEWLWRSGRQELQPDLRDLPPPLPRKSCWHKQTEGVVFTLSADSTERLVCSKYLNIKMERGHHIKHLLCWKVG